MQKSCHIRQDLAEALFFFDSALSIYVDRSAAILLLAVCIAGMTLATIPTNKIIMMI
jgi:hypothetical protein